jgi:CRP/FNR family cyclic AMP-dependent transcriptional regulator
VASGLDSARQTVSLLDADPDLAAGVPADDLEAARRRAVAGVVEVGPPEWDPRAVSAMAEPGWLGLFVIDGLMIRRVTVGRRAACELFGPSDLLRPWDADGEYEPLPINIDWLVLKTVRLAVLDAAFVLRTAPWPSINSGIVSRVVQRARYLSLTEAVMHLPRAHPRLLILFLLLAERWGKVGPDGVRVSLPLTHEVLGMLIGAQRPTVTIALQRLARAGLLKRERTDCWLLTNAAMERLRHPERLALIDADEDGEELA